MRAKWGSLGITTKEQMRAYKTAWQKAHRERQKKTWRQIVRKYLGKVRYA